MRNEVLRKFETNIGCVAQDPEFTSSGLQVIQDSELTTFGVVQNGMACLGYVEYQALRLQRRVKASYPNGLRCDESTTKLTAGLSISLMAAVFVGYLLKLTTDMPHEFFSEKGGALKTVSLFACAVGMVFSMAAIIVCGLKLKNNHQVNKQRFIENRYHVGSQAIAINHLLGLCKPFESLAGITLLDRNASGAEQLKCLAKIIVNARKIKDFYLHTINSKVSNVDVSSHLLAGCASISSDNISKKIMKFLRGIAKPVLQPTAQAVPATAPLWPVSVL
ncbi:MAG: hypothetical protein P1U63_01020 [Coxiellaceae bacterium]|nr:hypothetical protein [Coxiellaceae bacterium]